MSILVISSELDELVAVCDRVVVVRDRRHVAELVGDEIGTDAYLCAPLPATDAVNAPDAVEAA